MGNYCISSPTSIPWNQTKSRRVLAWRNCLPTPITQQNCRCRCVLDVSVYIKVEVKIWRHTHYSKRQHNRSWRGDISTKRHGESNPLSFLVNVISSGPITFAARSGAWIIRTLESWVRILLKSWLSASVCVVLSCIGRSLKADWSIVQGVLPNVWKGEETSHVGEGRRSFKDCRAADNNIIWNYQQQMIG